MLSNNLDSLVIDLRVENWSRSPSFVDNKVKESNKCDHHCLLKSCRPELLELELTLSQSLLFLFLISESFETLLDSSIVDSFKSVLDQVIVLISFVSSLKD